MVYVHGERQQGPSQEVHLRLGGQRCEGLCKRELMRVVGVVAERQTLQGDVTAMGCGECI